MHWAMAYAQGTVPYAYAQHERKNSKLEKVPSKHTEHTCKELIRALDVARIKIITSRAIQTGTLLVKTSFPD